MPHSSSSRFGLLAGSWHHEFSDLLSSARRDVLLVAPYITANGLRLVQSSLTPGHNRSQLRIKIITDLSPRAACQGATEPQAILNFWDALFQPSVRHLPKLHAKIYAVDCARAIVTSANLTSGGLFHNHEYGVRLTDGMLVQAIVADTEALADLGALVSHTSLVAYCNSVNAARIRFDRKEDRVSASVQRAFDAAISGAEDDLIRIKLGGAAVHQVFERTVRYLLTKHGPLRTTEIHEFVKQIHPDLCDDTIDRVIDGQRFGKKWKHAVRTAQQHLRKMGHIRREGYAWHILST